MKEYVTQPQANVHAIQGGKEQIVQVRNNFHTCSELQWLSNKRHQRDLKDHQHFKDHNDLKHLRLKTAQNHKYIL